MWKDDIGDNLKEIISGLEIQEGTLLYFSLETFFDGKKIDKWIINTKELSNAFYVVDKNDAKVENGIKVIEITYTTKSAEPVTIKFDDTKIVVHISKGDITNQISNNSIHYEGNSLYFNEKTVPDGKQIDKWKVNEKEIKRNSYLVDAGDAKIENGTKVIEITYTTKSAEPVTIKFDDTKIKVFVYKGNGRHQISNNSIHYEGRKLSIEWKGSLPDGQKIDKCYMNEKLFPYYPYDEYRIDIADAITEGSAKVINIGCILTTAEPIIIKFDDTKIKVKLNDNEISDGTTLYGGRRLYFSLKVPLPSEQLDSWIINGKTRVFMVYDVDDSDAVLENGVKVIRVTYKAKSA